VAPAGLGESRCGAERSHPLGESGRPVAGEDEVEPLERRRPLLLPRFREEPALLVREFELGCAGRGVGQGGAEARDR